MPFDNSNYNPLPIGHQRLLALADLLDTVPPEKFDMHHWDCGTTACAAGWAASIPSFREAGYECGRMGPRFAGLVGAGDALCAFFDIDIRQAAHLFAGGARTPKQEAAKIRAVVEKAQATSQTDSVGAVAALGGA